LKPKSELYFQKKQRLTLNRRMIKQIGTDCYNAFFYHNVYCNDICASIIDKNVFLQWDPLLEGGQVGHMGVTDTRTDKPAD
jgi:hypothetical protein